MDAESDRGSSKEKSEAESLLIFCKDHIEELEKLLFDYLRQGRDKLVLLQLFRGTGSLTGILQSSSCSAFDSASRLSPILARLKAYELNEQLAAAN